MSNQIEDRLIEVEKTAGIEAHGIERVPPERRTDVRIFDNFTLWLSANLVISTVVLGSLAIGVFKLGFWDSVAAIAIFNLLGILPVSFFSTLGPKLGLRQMTISRFSFGWTGAKIMALFNVAACLGWSAVNVIVGGQLVNQITAGVVPGWVGVLIIAALTTYVSLYGYAYVHRYERYAWLPMLFIFSAMFFLSAPNFTAVESSASGLIKFAAFMSFGSAVYGFATGWSSYAADYNVNQPETTPSSRVFWLTFLGCYIPCVMLEILGLALTTVPAFNGKMGGELFAAALSPMGIFGNLLLVFLALSIVANNIPNDYSLALSIQVVGGWFQRVNRAVWTLVGSIVYVLIAITSAKSFAQTLEGFLLLVAYWLGPWSIVLVIEHFVFRHGRYNVDDWNTPSRLPVGWAAITALTIGLFGVYLGAAQEKFVGPIAGLLNQPYGIDIGFELGIIFAGIAYLGLRRIELQGNRR
ncbi:MAG: cytosine permease [Chroococcidiopsidaceae cyanobacterium CP_BM_RX_35]|nr:cytosine permease [Chroococcidiopsidaceae cyanobacterium CP_BM_RX_35]